MEPVPDPIYNHPLKAGATRTPSAVVVVNYVIIVAIGHGLLKKFWHMVNVNDECLMIHSQHFHKLLQMAQRLNLFVSI